IKTLFSILIRPKKNIIKTTLIMPKNIENTISKQRATESFLKITSNVLKIATPKINNNEIDTIIPTKILNILFVIKFPIINRISVKETAKIIFSNVYLLIASISSPPRFIKELGSLYLIMFSFLPIIQIEYAPKNNDKAKLEKNSNFRMMTKT
ncbi:MAG: hypothetical protein QXJ14_04345, partial [Candidatus Aenigmatarchaeota archaeon]